MALPVTRQKTTTAIQDQTVVVDYKLGVDKLQVTVSKVHMDNKLKNAYVHLLLGDQSFKTSTSTGVWNESFIFTVPLHLQLFGTLQIDLYETKIFDFHVGRTEIRLSLLLGFPESFSSWYELWDRKYSESNTSALKRRSGKSGVGALQLKIHYNFKQIPCFQGSGDAATEEDTPRDAQEDEEDTLEATSLTTSMEFDAVDAAVFLEREDQAANVLDKFGDWLLSKETNSVLKNIRNLLASFGQGLDFTHAQMLQGMLQLERFYSTFETQKTGKRVLDLGRVEIPRHFYKYTMASYGWRGLNFFGKGRGIIKDSTRKDADKKALLEFLALPEDNLLSFQPASAGVFKPSFFIAKDELTESIVLVIRGTMSTIDVLTDFVCEYARWRDGLVHSGVLSAARWFYVHVFPVLLEYLQQFQLKKLVICGHSLGGATASVLSMIIAEQKLPEDISFHCYSYAPPPTVSMNLAIRYNDLIDSYVCEEDAVSRLSYGHMVDLRQMIVSAVEHSEGLNDIALCRDHIRRENKNVKLCLAGTIYLLYYEDKKMKPFNSMLPGADKRPVTPQGQPKPYKKVFMEESSVEFYDELLVTRTVFLQHIPNVYDKAFERAMETLMMELHEESSAVSPPITTEGVSSHDFLNVLDFSE